MSVGTHTMSTTIETLLRCVHAGVNRRSRARKCLCSAIALQAARQRRCDVDACHAMHERHTAGILM